MRNRPQSQSPDKDEYQPYANGTSSSTSTYNGHTHQRRTTPLSPSVPLMDHRRARTNGATTSSSNNAVRSLSLQMGDLPLASNGTTNNNHHSATSANNNYPYSATLDGTGGLRALPGRPRRKRQARSNKYDHHSHRKHSFARRCYNRWIKGFCQSFSSLFVAVALWYGLGVVSIATSKLLLTHYPGAVPPLVLTLQQMLLGTTLLRFLMQIRFLSSPGLQPCPTSAGSAGGTNPRSSRRWSYVSPPPPQRQSAARWLEQVTMHPHLLAAGIFFSTGFFTTNYAFGVAAASFVESIKASEPLSSAAVAWAWQIEILGRSEMASLGAIVLGVVFSTLGNHGASSGNSNPAVGDAATTATTLSSLETSLFTCALVLVANLCFSFRGLYQKLFRGTGFVLDDLNLQYRMQQVGVALFLLPALIWEGPSVISYWWHHASHHNNDDNNNSLVHFVLLSLVNGFCFTGYNLASTYILSRISVVHHAALNCLRRVFAICCTSVYFQVPLTWLGMMGIGLSTAGFLSFTHYKVKRQRQPKPLSSLLPVSVNPQLSTDEYQ